MLINSPTTHTSIAKPTIYYVRGVEKPRPQLLLHYNYLQPFLVLPATQLQKIVCRYRFQRSCIIRMAVCGSAPQTATAASATGCEVSTRRTLNKRWVGKRTRAWKTVPHTAARIFHNKHACTAHRCPPGTAVSGHRCRLNDILPAECPPSQHSQEQQQR